MSYKDNVAYFKALSDVNRLMIVDMLSCGELCACKILEKLEITQPTLSHHMKILCGCGLVRARKDGKWSHYCLDDGVVAKLKFFLSAITSNKAPCICH
ncbi:MAG: ArsR/SmtB family transcription factor [Candidatus Adiutrix sp.]